jgi:hypothetical protein
MCPASSALARDALYARLYMPDTPGRVTATWRFRTLGLPCLRELAGRNERSIGGRSIGSGQRRWPTVWAYFASRGSRASRTVPGEPCHISARTSVLRRLMTDTQELAVYGVSWATAGYGEARNDLVMNRSAASVPRYGPHP